MSALRTSLGVALAMLLAACASPVTSEPPAPQQAQLEGRLHLTTGADYDPHDPLTLRYVDARGLVVAEPDSIEAETTIWVDRALPVGRVQVLANDQACGGPVDIGPNVEVDVVLAVADGICSLTIANMHAAGAIAHPEPRTALGVFVVPGSILVVRPLDPGNAIDPIRKEADERAEVADFAVPPGRYELSVLLDGAVLTTLEIDLKRGQEFWYTLRVLPPTVPRLCGGIPREQCEAAVTAAYADSGYGPPAAASLVSVQVRPSGNSGCYEPPVFDVLFDVRGEQEPLAVTVATTPDGRLLACTY